MNFARLPGIGLFLISTSALWAQIRFDSPVVITRENGLPPGEIRCIRKGEDGFVWIGTTDGLCRFDGSIFKTYLSVPGDANSLLGNSILDVAAEQDFVWVGTTRGLTRISNRSGAIRHYQFTRDGSVPVDSLRVNQDVSVLLKDRGGNLFAGTGAHGFFQYDRPTDSFRSFEHNETFFNDMAIREGADNILCIAEDPVNDSLVFFGAYSGIWQLNKVTGELRWYFRRHENKQEQVWKNNARRMLAHSNGKIYYGGWRGGISYFNKEDRSFGEIDLGEFIAGSAVISILPAGRDEIMISTIMGMALYDTRQEKVLRVERNEPVNGRYYGANYIDDQNRAWLYNFQALYIFDPVIQQFNTFRYGDESRGWSFAFYSHQLNDSTILVIPRHENAVYRFNRRTAQFSRTPVTVSSRNTNFITRGVAVAPDGTITVSSDLGLHSYNPRSGSLVEHAFQPDLHYDRYRDVLWDSDGLLWLSAERDGILRWDPATNAVRQFLDELLPAGEQTSLSQLNFLREDDQGNIWFSRNTGIGVYIRKSETVENFMYTSSPGNSFDHVIGITADKNGKIWFSDRDGQIGFADSGRPSDGIVTKIDLREKFDIDYLYDIACDDKGQLWGHGADGLVRINTKDLSVAKFTFDYGQMQDDFFSLSILNDGHIFLGGRNNIVIANPDELKPNAELPEPYLTDLEVLQTAQKISDTLLLDYTQHSFAFGFSARAYTLGKDTRFRYRLVPFDEHWVEAKDRRFANYTNIPPGQYTFEVQAANNEGMWNPYAASMSINITEAWWATWWFRLGFVLALSAAVLSLYQWRSRQNRQKVHQQLVFERKLAQVQMSALRAQMNPHFLFNSLNSIDRYIIRNESRRASEYLNNFARLIRIILNNSRSNYVSLKEELEALRLYLEMECLRFSDSFVYAISVDESIDVDLVSIPPMLIQPFVENAVWHGLMPKEGSGEDKSVQVVVSRTGDHLRFIIEDNGVGRPASGANDQTREVNGRKSMGMQITSDRMEIIRKLYGVESSVHIEDLRHDDGSPRGTRVEFIITTG